MSTVLDLSGADTSGFDPVPAGRYNVHVHKTEMDQTKNEGKLPAGTPLVKVQLKIQDGECEGRLIFDQFVLPPAGYEKQAIMLGFLVRFLVALGYDESKVKSKGFNLQNLQDLHGKEAVVTVSYEKAKEGSSYSDRNVVKGYKPAGSEIGTSAGSGLI